MPNSMPEFELERYIPYRFAVLAARLSAELAKQYRSKYGISIPEWRVLLNVGYSEDVSVKDIEKRVSLEKSKISRAVSKLESNGYLTKQIDQDDRRLLKLALTKQGVALVSELIPIAEAYQSKIYGILGEQTKPLQLALDRLLEETS